ncbi:MAG: response regulator [Longimicrobiales bacterium]
MASRTILIVDDNPGNRSVFSRALLQYGYRVLEAENGAEAIRLASEHLPDLILMDLEMPVMNGWDAAELLKRDPRTRDIRIIAISVHDVFEHEAVHFASFLSKPISPSLLLAEVQRLVPDETSSS